MPIPIDKILEAAQKAGFDTELKVASRLSERSWSYNQSVYFIDKDENKGRELDIAAFKNFLDLTPNNEITCAINLCIEVKKTADPFIFYSNSNNSSYVAMAYGLLHWKNSVDPKILPWKEIERSRPFSNEERISRSYSSFKDGKTQHIQSAVLSAFKAAIHERDNCNETFSHTSKDICFFIPVVVVEGDLYECYFESGSEDLVAKEVDYLVYYQNYRSEHYSKVSNPVIISRLSYFENLLSEFENWGSEMLYAMVRNHQKNVLTSASAAP